MMDETPETTAEATEQRKRTRLTSLAQFRDLASDDLTDDLKIFLGEFEGPLDLLLHLIRQEQVSIYDIPVARITDEYLRYLRVMQELDIAVAGDFLVMAATLIELKTKMLLPRDPLRRRTEEDDPRSDLVNQLLEYQKYKAAAQMLWSRATVEQAVFKRAEIETDKNNPEVAVGVFDLLESLSGNSRAAQRRSVAGDRARRDIDGGNAGATAKHGDVGRRIESASVFRTRKIASRVGAGFSVGAGTGANH